MSRTHPSDEILQQFVLEPAACSAEEINHIETCPDCQAAVAAYTALTSELASQTPPTFDFDLAAAVITQLQCAATPTATSPAGPTATSPAPSTPASPVAALTIVLIAAFIAVPLWLFRRSAYFVFTDMPAVFYCLVLAAAGIVVGLFLLRLYKKYQQVINLINE